MFRIIFVIFILLSVGFSACVTQQPVTETNNPADEYTNQQKAELSVNSYLRKTFDTMGIYQPYGYGKVQEIIPEQVTQLSELKEMKKLLPGMKDHYGNRLDSVMIAYDTMIAQKEREIQTKKIRSFWKISHIFMTKVKGDSVRAQEVEFTLDPNFKMYDAHAKMYAGLTDEEGKWFDFYYNQFPLFETWDDEGDDTRSMEVYSFYDKKLMQSGDSKTQTLKQVLFIIQHIKTSGEFSNQKIAEAIVKNKLLVQEGKAYQGVKFSTLKAIVKKSPDGTQDLIGYSIVHLYKTTTENLIVEKALYFEFDPWLIMAGYLPVEPPYDVYFEN